MLKLHLYEIFWTCIWSLLSIILTFYIVYFNIKNLCSFFWPLEIYFSNILYLMTFPLKCSTVFSLLFNIPYIFWLIILYLKSAFDVESWHKKIFLFKTFCIMYFLLSFFIYINNYRLVYTLVKGLDSANYSIFYISENLVSYIISIGLIITCLSIMTILPHNNFIFNNKLGVYSLSSVILWILIDNMLLTLAIIIMIIVIIEILHIINLIINKI